MGMAFKKAEKRQQKLRLALFGPSGAGKTMTALRIATGMGGPIALLDTEHGSASKYADRFDFDALNLIDKTIDGGYLPGFVLAREGRYPVLIIDSLSHGWDELLEEVDRIAKAKYRGNTWSAWSEGTPKQKKMIEAILSYPGHVICTMRSDTAWEQEKDDRGKVKPVKVGLKPRGGKGIEFEFDMLMEMNVEHYATVTKDRTSKYQDKIIEKPGEDFGKELVAWLSEGKPEEPRAKTAPSMGVVSPDQPSPNADHNREVLSNMKETMADHQEPAWDEVEQQAKARADAERVVTEAELTLLMQAAAGNRITSSQVAMQVRKPFSKMTKADYDRVWAWVHTKKA